MELFRQIFLLLLVSALCGLARGWFAGEPDWEGSGDPWSVSVQDARRLAAPIWVDGRAATAFAQTHREGAVQLDLEDWDAGIGGLLELWEPDSTVIVYCEGQGCKSSREIAARLRDELQSETVFWLLGGWPALQEAGEVP